MLNGENELIRENGKLIRKEMETSRYDTIGAGASGCYVATD
jgi:hypothetical protein